MFSNMGFANFLKRFGGLDAQPSSVVTSEKVNPTSEYIKAQAFNKDFAYLLSQDKFIARSDYKALAEAYRDIWQLFDTLEQTSILNEYVAKHGLDYSQIAAFRKSYAEIKDLAIESPSIKKHNDAYIKRHIDSEKLI